MKILIVEDHTAFLSELETTLRQKCPDIEILSAGSRDEAIALAESSIFDLAVLDIKIPSTKGTLDSDTAFGKYVYEEIKRIHRGMPVTILSSYAEEDFILRILRFDAQQVDLWGSGVETPIYQMFRKDDTPAFYEHVSGTYEEIQQLSSISIDLGASACELKPHEVRAVQLLCRRNFGHHVRAKPFSGGLSGSRVMRLEISDQDDNARMTLAVKIGEVHKIEREFYNYKTEAFRLHNDHFPHLLDSIKTSLYGYEAIAYSLLAGYDNTLLDLLIENESNAAAFIDTLKGMLAPWENTQSTVDSNVASLRREIIDDNLFKELAQILPEFDLEQFEQSELRLKCFTQHGDLHPGNILLPDQTRGTLIDFGEVRTTTAALDPVTLELSLLFHPDARGLSSSMSPASLSSWDNLENYAPQTPYPEFVSRVREWSHERCSSKQVYATAYAYTLKQLKYNRVKNEDSVRILLAAIISAFRRCT